MKTMTNDNAIFADDNCVTNKKTISRPMIAWRREIFVTDKYEDSDKQQMRYLPMTILLQTKRQSRP